MAVPSRNENLRDIENNLVRHTVGNLLRERFRLAQDLGTNRFGFGFDTTDSSFEMLS